MTDTTTTQAPTNTAPAPIEPTPENTQDMGKFLDAVVQDSVRAVLPQDAITDEKPRDELGRFVKQATEASDAAQGATATPQSPDSTPTADATTTDATPSEDAPTEPVLPEGFAAVKPIEGRELAIPFKVFDAEGELAIPDLTIELEYRDKPRREPLDKVVRLAKDGIYNHERELAVQQREAQAAQADQRARELEQYVQQQQAYIEALLADENQYLTAQEQYAQHNTPEARLARMEQEREAERQQWAMQQQAAAAEAFATNELLPALDLLTKTLDTVGSEEIAAKLVIAMKPYERNGIVPPEAHGAIKQVLVQDILPWAQAIHSQRTAWKEQATAEAKEAKAKADATAKAAQATAQKAKRLVGAVTRPAGQAPSGTGTREAPKPKKIETADEGMEDSIQSILSAMRGAA